MQSARHVHSPRHAAVTTAIVTGIEGQLVEVSVELTAGLPAFVFLGMGEAAARECRVRVQAALQHARFPMPSGRVQVTLTPVELPKSSSGLDLPIALAILAAQGVLPV